MPKTLSIRVRTERLPLSRAATDILRHLDRYDWILFTSKHAANYLVRELSERKIALPKEPRIAAVGPATARALRALGLSAHVIPEQHRALDLAKALGDVKGKRIFFPRSRIANADAARQLRARGARIRIVPLYTTAAEMLTALERRALNSGAYKEIAFSSPSGVDGFLGQLTAGERRHALRLPARCIGPTTARAARAAGFRKVSSRGML